MLKFYHYPQCSTCQRAKKILKSRGVPYEEINLVEHPPSKSLLEGVLEHGDYSLKDLFNRSGQLYREWNMKAKVGTLSREELLDLLSHHGKLVKRPILTDEKSIFVVGLDESRYDKIGEV